MLKDVLRRLQRHHDGALFPPVSYTHLDVYKRQDEATLKVRMDLAGGLRRARALGNGPGAHFLRPGGEEADQAEKVVAQRCV